MENVPPRSAVKGSFPRLLRGATVWLGACRRTVENPAMRLVRLTQPRQRQAPVRRQPLSQVEHAMRWRDRNRGWRIGRIIHIVAQQVFANIKSLRGPQLKRTGCLIDCLLPRTLWRLVATLHDLEPGKGNGSQRRELAQGINFLSMSGFFRWSLRSDAKLPAPWPSLLSKIFGWLVRKSRLNGKLDRNMYYSMQLGTPIRQGGKFGKHQRLKEN